jgi:methyl-accepting chemotaxis protein
VKEVEHDYRDFSKSDWEKAQFRFDKLTGECYEKFEKEFTSAEERKIFKNSLKYSFFKLSSELQVDLKSDEMKQFSEEINKLIDSEKDLNKIIKKIENNKDFKKASEDLKMGVEHFGKGLEKIGKELEKVLKDIENKS